MSSSSPTRPSTSANTSSTSPSARAWRRASKPLAGGVALHLACHARAQNMGQKAAEMLRLIPDADLAVIERCSGHGGSWGVMKENFEVALKVGRPVARQAINAGKRHRRLGMPARRRPYRPGHRNALPMASRRRATPPSDRALRPRLRSLSDGPARSPPPTSCPLPTMAADTPRRSCARPRCARSAFGAEAQAARLEVGPVATFYFESFDTMLHADPGDAVHREGRRGADRRRAGGLQPADPERARAGRDGDVRDRRSRAARPSSWRASAASRRPPSSRSRRDAWRACRRPTRTAPPPRARPRRCSSSISPSRPRRSPAFRKPGARIVVGFDHPEYGHMAVMPEAVRAALARGFRLEPPNKGGLRFC